QAVTIGLEDTSAKLRDQAIRALAHLPHAAEKLAPFLEKATTADQQAALAALGATKDEPATTLLASALKKLSQGQWPAASQLDLIEAVQMRNDPALSSALQAYEQSLPKDDPLAEYRFCLTGGNSENGFAVFQRSDASCVRCHTVRKQGGIVG